MNQEVSQKNAILIPLMHLVAVGINTAEQLRPGIETNKMRHQIKYDLNKSHNALIMLQNAEVEVSDGKKKLMQVFFSDERAIVDVHTQDLLDILEFSPEHYIACILAVAAAIQRIESELNHRRKKSEFWVYFEKVVFPVRKYFKKEIVQELASQIIDKVTELTKSESEIQTP